MTTNDQTLILSRDIVSQDGSVADEVGRLVRIIESLKGIIEVMQQTNDDLFAKLNLHNKAMPVGEVKCFYEEDNLPKVFIAIYGDLSGGNIFCKQENGLYRQPRYGFDVPDNHWFADAGYLWFVALPDDINILEMKRMGYDTRKG